MKRPILLLLTTLLFILSGCGKSTMDGPSGTSVSAAYLNSKASVYFTSTQKVVVEVYYEAGAEPFAGNTAKGVPYWSILEDNLKAIFKYKSVQPTIIVPKTLSEMHLLPSQNKTSWSADEVLALNSTYKEASPSTTEARFYIYFLKGNASDSNSVIGFSVNGTPVMGIFKSVITSTGGPIVQRYVEQSTIVHELGHALGFVNNGVPMKAPHQDAAHGAHTTNSNCVMYWQNEGLTDLMGFVAHFISTGDTVMWGPEVLADAQAFSK